MIALLISPIYILLCIYALRWFILWLGACHGVLKKWWIRLAVIGIYIAFILSIPIGFILPGGGLKRMVTRTGNYWLGVLAYMLLVLFAADGCRLALGKLQKTDSGFLRGRKAFVCVGAMCLSAIVGVTLYGVYHAKDIHVTPYEVNVEKDGSAYSQLRIVLAADLHLGYNTGCTQMEKMAEKINAEHPDIVVFAGDIFDNDYAALDDPKRLQDILSMIDAPLGVYACYGNHDIQEPILAGFTFSNKAKKESSPQMDAFLEKAGIRLLRDEGVLVDDSFYIYGRADKERPGRGIDERKTVAQVVEGLDMDKPVIVLDHEPRELNELADAGVDIDLSGHTHNGQIFPGNLVIKMFWEHPYGYAKKGQMHSIVTSGVGVFGPNMRIGTKAEICTINVKFNDSNSSSVH